MYAPSAPDIVAQVGAGFGSQTPRMMLRNMSQLGWIVAGTSNHRRRSPGMPIKAEACRVKAKRCAMLAAHSADSYSQAQLRGTAALWRQMAHSVETLEEIERKRAATAEQGVGAMTPRPKQRTDPSMTLHKLRELGVHKLNVLCLNPSCGHEITFSADDYGDDTELSWFRPRMICARCGNRRLDVQPNF